MNSAGTASGWRCIHFSAFRAMSRAAERVYRRHSPRRHAGIGDRPDADAGRIVRCARLPCNTSRSSTNCFPRPTERNSMSEAALPHQTKKSVALSGIVAGKHGPLHASDAAATISTTAATTFSISRPIANSKKSPICSSTARCRRRRNSPPIVEQSKSMREFPAALRTVLESLPAGFASDGRAANRVLHARDASCRNPTTTTRPRRKTSSTGCWLRSVRCSLLLVSLRQFMAGVSTSRRDEDSIGGQFLHLLHGETSRSDPASGPCRPR